MSKWNGFRIGMLVILVGSVCALAGDNVSTINGSQDENEISHEQSASSIHNEAVTTVTSGSQLNVVRIRQLGAAGDNIAHQLIDGQRNQVRSIQQGLLEFNNQEVVGKGNHVQTNQLGKQNTAIQTVIGNDNGLPDDEISILQNGRENQATQSADGDLNLASIRQVGMNNTANQTIKGTGNDVTINQRRDALEYTSKYNTATQNVDGTGQEVIVVQRGGRFNTATQTVASMDNLLRIVQDMGKRNEATQTVSQTNNRVVIQQTGGLSNSATQRVSGDENVVKAFQTDTDTADATTTTLNDASQEIVGVGNTATINQASTDGGDNRAGQTVNDGDRNTLTINQLNGTGNRATQDIDGNQNTAETTQVGNNNHSDTAIRGGSLENTVIHAQTGNSNVLTTNIGVNDSLCYLNEISQAQTGNLNEGTVTVEDAARRNQVNVNQQGDRNISDISISGLYAYDNVVDLTQGHAVTDQQNEATVSIVDSHKNNIKWEQFESLHTGTVAITGGHNNQVTILQQGVIPQVMPDVILNNVADGVVVVNMP